MQAPNRKLVSDCSRLSRRRPLPSTVAISSPACLSRSTVPLSLYSTRANPSLLSTTVHVPRTYTGALPGDCQYLARQFHASPCASSDNLLGYSPMSRPPVPTTSQQASVLPSSKSGPTWGTDANTAGGGVWAQTSAKREKLAELLTELNSTGVDTGAICSLHSSSRSRAFRRPNPFLPS